jgi:nicotinate-nucleotide adenylyltransferase
LSGFRVEQGDRPLILLIGADAFAGLPAWRRWRELFELAHIGVLTRPGMDVHFPEALRREISARRVDETGSLAGKPAGKVIDLMITPLEVSASRIRELLAAGREPRYLLPEGVSSASSLLAPYRRRSSAQGR